MRHSLTSVAAERALLVTAVVLLSCASVLWLEDEHDDEQPHYTRAARPFADSMSMKGQNRDSFVGYPGRASGGQNGMLAEPSALSAASGSEGSDRVGARARGDDRMCDAVNRYVFVKT